MIVKEVKLMALSRGLRLHQYLDNWLISSQSQEEAQVNTQAVVDLTQSLGWIINQEKSELERTQVFSLVGCEYHLDSAVVKPTQERWLKLQDLILRRLGRSLRSKFYKGSVVRSGKKATNKRPRIEDGLTGPSKVQRPVPEPNSSSCNGQLNGGSLHKQTRRKSLSGNVSSPVEDHDMVSLLSHNIKSQTHPRMSECDGRPPVQVKPSAVNRMVTASTDLAQVIHSSCRPVCH